MHRSVLLLSVLFFSILILVSSGLPAQNLGEVGARAPVFRLPTFADQKVYLKDHIGENVVVLSFWSTSCIPCRRELPQLCQLARQYAPDGLEVYTICIDGKKSKQAAQAFAREYIVGVPVLWDKTGRIARLYNVTHLPRIYLIDQNAVIRSVYSGFTQGQMDELKQNIERLTSVNRPETVASPDHTQKQTNDIAPCPLEERMKEADLVDAAVVIPDLAVDLVYATTENMFGKSMFECLERAYLRPETVWKLARAQGLLKERHPRYSLKILDATRPRSVQKKMWARVVDTPLQPYVANPAQGSMHNFGAAVDITITNAAGEELDMGEPSPRAKLVGKNPAEINDFLTSIEVSGAQQKNRTLLQDVMTGAGFTGLNIEWWHFRAFDKDFVRSQFDIIE